MILTKHNLHVPLPLRGVIKRIVFDSEELELHVVFFDNGDLIFPDFIGRNLREKAWLITGHAIDVKWHFSHLEPPAIGAVYRQVAYSVSGTVEDGHDHVPIYRPEVRHEDTPYFENVSFNFFNTIAGLCADIMDPNRHFFDD